MMKDLENINKPFQGEELEAVLCRLNKKSSPGFDEIHYLYFINSPKIVKHYLLEVINKSWITGEIPDDLKLSIIIPILKPK